MARVEVGKSPVVVARRAGLATAFTRLSNSHLVAWLVFGVVAFLVLNPVGWLVVGSFLDGRPGITRGFTLNNYVEAYSDPVTYRLFLNSVLIIGSKTILAGAMAVFLAWVV